MALSSEGRSNAISKLESIIEQGRESALTVINHVMSNQPQDRLPMAKRLQFSANHGGKAITVAFPDPQHGGFTEDRTFGVHRHALGQMATAIDMPMKFLDALQEERADWGRELLAHNLNTIFHERNSNKRHLVRTINGEIRGFLSDQYRRIDSRPIVEAFATAVQAKGAQPYAGHVTDTKIAIQAVFPQVFEPVPGEMAAYGLSLENSDFGNGALSVRAYLLRIWCNNMAITEETMRQIHLGRRLDENMVYSQHTYELDSQTTVSALKDVINLQLDRSALENRIEQLKLAAGTAVTIEAARAQLKKVLNKGEVEEAIKVFESNDEYNLPAGNTAWRMSNAISWIANGKDVAAERKLELSRIAGEVLPKAA